MGEKPNSDTAFLHDVARRIFHQCTHAMGFDQGDSDRLHFIANCLTTAQAALAAKEAELAAEREKVEKLRARVAELEEFIAAKDAVDDANRVYRGARYPEDVHDAHRDLCDANERLNKARAALSERQQ